jgi:ABC-type dipeptide/oligopeptide/nickel transport system permease subunit
VIALLAPWLAPGDPFRGDLAVSMQPPSHTFLLGSDAQGRDVLSRVLYGARLSLTVGLISQSIALALGVTLGLVAGFYGRWVDGLIMRVADVTLAFPSLLLLIAIAAAVKPSLPVVFVVIGIVGWAGMARLVRGGAAARGLEYAYAARGGGVRCPVGRHLLPNVIAPVIVAATLGIGGATGGGRPSFIGLAPSRRRRPGARWSPGATCSASRPGCRRHPVWRLTRGIRDSTSSATGSARPRCAGLGRGFSVAA